MTSAMMQLANLQVVASVAATVAGLLGPNGKSKLVLNQVGRVVQATDAGTLLSLLSLQNPVAIHMRKMCSRCADGSTSAVVLAGALADRALRLIQNGADPLHIVDGFRLGLEIALRTIDERKTLADDDEGDALFHMVNPKLSKFYFLESEIFGACAKIKQAMQSEMQVVSFVNGSAEREANITVFGGMVLLNKRFADPSMGFFPLSSPSPVRVLLLACPLEPALAKSRGYRMVSDDDGDNDGLPDADAVAHMRRRRQQFCEQVVAICLRLKVRLVLCQWSIDLAIVQAFVALRIAAVAYVAGEDLERAARVSGGRISWTLEEDMAVGVLDSVADEEQQQRHWKSGRRGDEDARQHDEATRRFVVLKCEAGRGICVIVTANSNSVVENAKRTLQRCVGSMRQQQLLYGGAVVAGGGLIELDVYDACVRECRESNNNYAMAWAEALLQIPKQLRVGENHSVKDLAGPKKATYLLATNFVADQILASSQIIK